MNGRYNKQVEFGFAKEIEREVITKQRKERWGESIGFAKNLVKGFATFLAIAIPSYSVAEPLNNFIQEGRENRGVYSVPNGISSSNYINAVSVVDSNEDGEIEYAIERNVGPGPMMFFAKREPNQEEVNWYQTQQND